MRLGGRKMLIRNKVRLTIIGSILVVTLITAFTLNHFGLFKFHADVVTPPSSASVSYIDSNGQNVNINSNQISLNITSTTVSPLNNVKVSSVFLAGGKLYALGNDSSTQKNVIFSSDPTTLSWASIDASGTVSAINRAGGDILNLNALSSTGVFAVGYKDSKPSLWTASDGKTFTAANIPAPYANATALGVLNSNFAFAVVGNTFYKTTNGGQNWTNSQITDLDQKLSGKYLDMGVAFSTSDLFVVGIPLYHGGLGNEGTGVTGQGSGFAQYFNNVQKQTTASQNYASIYSADGGATWSDPQPGCNDFVTIGSSNIVCVRNGSINLSTDKGHSFAQKQAAQMPIIPIDTVSAVDATHLLALGTKNAGVTAGNYSSSDGGATWTAVAGAADGWRIFDSVAINANTVLAYGRKGDGTQQLLVKATLSGSTWTLSELGITGTVAGEFFTQMTKVADGLASAVSIGGNVYFKSDANTDWKELSDFFIASPQIVTSNPRIVSSSGTNASSSISSPIVAPAPANTPTELNFNENVFSPPIADSPPPLISPETYSPAANSNTNSSNQPTGTSSTSSTTPAIANPNIVIFSGNIIDSKTRNPIKDATISVYANRYRFLPFFSKKVIEVKTDSSGHYTLSFTKELKKYYHVGIKAQNYSSKSITLDVSKTISTLLLKLDKVWYKK